MYFKKQQQVQLLHRSKIFFREMIRVKDEIKQIRQRLNMTQKLFAAALGVSVKTVEAWESGTNTPTGIANRMLELLSRDNGLFERCAIVARQ